MHVWIVSKEIRQMMKNYEFQIRIFARFSFYDFLVRIGFLSDFGASGNKSKLECGIIIKNVNKHDTHVLGTRKRTHTRYNFHIFGSDEELGILMPKIWKYDIIACYN